MLLLGFFFVCFFFYSLCFWCLLLFSLLAICHWSELKRNQDTRQRRLLIGPLRIRACSREHSMVESWLENSRCWHWQCTSSKTEVQGFHGDLEKAHEKICQMMLYNFVIFFFIAVNASRIQKTIKKSLNVSYYWFTFPPFWYIAIHPSYRKFRLRFEPYKAKEHLCMQTAHCSCEILKTLWFHCINWMLSCAMFLTLDFIFCDTVICISFFTCGSYLFVKKVM